MLAHQKGQQFGVFRVDAVLLGKAAYFLLAQHRMIAASAFGNVVKQGCRHQNPRVAPVGGQLRAQRVFVHMLGIEKTADVAQHHEDVLIDRINVEQIVLHLAHDFAKRRQVVPQHRCLVHEPQGMRYAVRRLQNLHELLPVGRGGPKRTVHDLACVVQGAQRTCR